MLIERTVICWVDFCEKVDNEYQLENYDRHGDKATDRHTFYCSSESICKCPCGIVAVLSILQPCQIKWLLV